MIPPRQYSHPPQTPSSLSQTAFSPTTSMQHPSSVPQKRGSTSNTMGTPSMPPTRKGSVDSVKQESGNGKKQRVSLSCAQCAKRKQKCNREFPCQHCLARKVPELCVPYNPQSRRGLGTEGPDPQTSARLDRMEDILSVVLRHHSGLWSYQDVKRYMNAGPYNRVFPSTASSPASPRLKALAAAAAEHADSPSHTDSMSHDGHNHDYDVGEVESEDLGKGVEKGWLGELDGGIPESLEAKDRVKMKLDIHGTPAQNLQRLITDFGVSPHKIAELVQELPPKHFADKIIDWFFSGFNYVRYPIDEKMFRKSYEDLYDASKAVDPSNVRALPLVFIILAMAVRLAPEEWAGDEQTRKLSSLRMYWSSRRSILIATAVQSESIELVISRLMSAMYLVLIHDRRLTECWSQLGASIRTAQAIGLHRDGTKLGLDPFETEYRRRLWSYLYHADKLYSLVLGRPPSLSDSYTDTQDPVNVDLTEYHNLKPNDPAPQPLCLTEPTTATFLILRKQLSKILGHIAHHFQKLDEPAKYADVIALQGEMEAFTESLPPCFRLHDPDKSKDKDHFWLPIHRMMLLSEVLVTIIILHRPWLLRKLSTNHYAVSRTACFEAAKLDFQLRQDFQREVPLHQVYAVYGQFKTFNSAMIAGISAIIDPRGPDGDQMRKILTTFLEQNPWEDVAKKDETTQKEVQIIMTLSRRAAQLYEDSFSPGELNSQDKDSASLLLALGEVGEAQKARTRSNARSKKDASANNAPSPWGQKQPAKLHHQWPKENHINVAGLGGIANFGYAGKVDQSPHSATSQEDDHSQKLLDNWINNNSALSFGSLNDVAPMMTREGNIAPNQPQSTPNSNMNFTSSDGQGMGFNSNSGFMGNFPMSFPQDMSSNSTTMWPMSSESTPINHANNVEGASFSLQTAFNLATPAPIGDSAGAQGMMNQSANGGMQIPENSDEYWNTLIDGILGTTSNGFAGTGMMN